MIQFNLLPDSKLANVTAKRSERKVMYIATVAAVVSIGILLLSLSAVGVARLQANSAASDVTKYTNQINQTPNLVDMLTVQNQLSTIISLRNQDPAITRLFTYLPQITPTQASISQLNLDFGKDTMEASGTANSLAAVNEFADTLKFTTYKISGANTTKTAFTSVVLANFGRDPAGANFDFQLKYDPALFDQTQAITLSVPQNYISTRSFIELPNSALFSSGGSSR